MKIFTKKPKCSCGEKSTKKIHVSTVEISIETCKQKVFSIKVLGTGCKTCHQLYENTKMAASEVNISAEVQYITDIREISDYGIMSTPALMINEKIAAAGRLLKTSEIVNLLLKYTKN